MGIEFGSFKFIGGGTEKSSIPGGGVLNIDGPGAPCCPYFTVFKIIITKTYKKKL